MTTRSAKGNVVEKLAQAFACFLFLNTLFCGCVGFPIQAGRPSRPGFCRRQNTGLARAVRSEAIRDRDSVRTKQMACAHLR